MTRLIRPCPTARNGVHRWLLSAANTCRNAGSTESETFAFLEERSRNCGRPVPKSEIRDAVNLAFRSTETRARNGTILRPADAVWPTPDQAGIAAIIDKGIRVADLPAKSPAVVDVTSISADSLIDALFPGDPLLCVAREKPQQAITAPRSTWRGELETCALMVPSPMRSISGITKSGARSTRCVDNVGPRTFLVIEFDDGDLDSQAARLWHFAQHAPLVLVVFSGGRSLHGWFNCVGVPEDSLRNFMRRCVRLGADPATWCPCQMVRVPGGLRDNGQRQAVYYFNPFVVAPRVIPAVSGPVHFEAHASQP